MKEDIQYLVVDLFAGAGGVSTGIERAVDSEGNKIAKVIAAVNHDRTAIRSHKLNHPETYHYVEDVLDMNFSHLSDVIKYFKSKYPLAKLVLWASAECAHHSIAKGGPKEEGSRSLPYVLHKYMDIANFDMVLVENVKEFLDWGPLGDTGYPVKDLKGETYKHWRDSIKERGYNYDYRVDNAADFEAYTSRVRYFGSFTKPGISHSFPKPTHSKDLKSGLKPWLHVKEVLNLNSHGKSIFAGTRKRSDNTFRRVYKGCVAHVGENFLVQYNGTSHHHSIEKPCGTLTTKDRFAKIHLLDQQYGNGSCTDANRPCPTLTTIPKVNLTTVQFLDNPQWGGAYRSIDRPCFTLIARMDKAPPSIVSAVSGPKTVLSGDDSPYERKLKQFMLDHGISDIKMRMLEIEEMLEIMGFGKDYKLLGGVTDKKRFIGNAVVCDYTQAWFENMVKERHRWSEL